MDKDTKIRVEDKRGFLKRYDERMEELEAFYGEYVDPPIENMNRLNSIIHGTRIPTLCELEIIAKTLECSVEWLLDGSGECPELNWDDAPVLKKELRTFRSMYGLTQKALAAELGIKPIQISKYENGTPVDQFVIDYIKEKYNEDIRQN